MSKKLLKWLSVLLAIWFLFSPKPYDIIFSILLVIPILTIFIQGFKNSSFMSWYQLQEMGGGKHAYEVGNAFNFITWILAFRVLVDFNFEDSFLIYYPIGIAVVMVLLLVFMPGNNRKGFKPRKMHMPKFWLSLMLGLNILLYLFTATYGVNCVFDRTEPATYKLEVVNKYISSYRRGGSYHLILAPWGNLKTTKRIKVKQSFYDSININDIIPINCKKGLFNIPWYYLPGKGVL